MKQLAAFALAALLLVPVIGCDDDGTRPKVTTSPYKDLSAEWHVLFNLQESYNRMDADAYTDIFDPDHFTFYFYPGDVGGDIPASWDYAADVTATTNMFTGQGGLNSNPILSIDLTLRDLETVPWTDVTDHPDFPGETLRRATVIYDFFIDTTIDIQYITAGSPTIEVVVRKSDGKWKIVDWSDLSISLLQRTATGTEEYTWSAVKGSYQGDG